MSQRRTMYPEPKRFGECAKELVQETFQMARSEGFEGEDVIDTGCLRLAVVACPGCGRLFTVAGVTAHRKACRGTMA